MYKECYHYLTPVPSYLFSPQTFICIWNLTCMPLGRAGCQASGLSDTRHPAQASLGGSDPPVALSTTGAVSKLLIWVLSHLVHFCNWCRDFCLCLFFPSQSSPACSSSWHACCTSAWHSLEADGSKPGAVHLPHPSPHNREYDPTPTPSPSGNCNTWNAGIAITSSVLKQTYMCTGLSGRVQSQSNFAWFESRVTKKQICDLKSCNLLGPQFPHLYHRDDTIKPYHKVMGGAKIG